MRSGISVLVVVAACGAVAGGGAVARALDINTNGTIIGVVNEPVWIGQNPVSPPITVFANAGTDIQQQVWVHKNSTLNMSGGLARNTMTLNDSSRLDLSGGVIGQQGWASASLTGWPSSVINMSGGTVYGGLSSTGVMNVSGGTFGMIWARGNSVVNFRGGSFTFDAVITGVLGTGNSVTNIYGLDLQATYVGINGTSDRYALTGFLQDGTSLQGMFFAKDRASNATFNLINIPAPGAGSAALLGVGMLAVRRRPRALVC